MPETNITQFQTFKMKTGATTQNQYTVAVLHSTEGEIDNPGGADAANLAGVIQETTLAAGQAGALAVSGVTLVKIASAVVVGDTLVVNGTDGRVKPKVSSKASGVGLVGRALSAASSANSLVKCQLAIPNEIST